MLGEEEAAAPSSTAYDRPYSCDFGFVNRAPAVRNSCLNILRATRLASRRTIWPLATSLIGQPFSNRHDTADSG